MLFLSTPLPWRLPARSRFGVGRGEGEGEGAYVDIIMRPFITDS
jgi:hypothetical protein